MAWLSAKLKGKSFKLPCDFLAGSLGNIMNEKHLKIQFRRLRRHLKSTTARYDDVALLDLSHSLRIWCDMKDFVDSWCKEHNYDPIFTKPIKSKEVKKILGDSKYFSVPTASLPEMEGTQIAGIMYTSKALSAEEVKKLYEADIFREEKVNQSFSNWLGTGIIDSSIEGEKLQISRENIMRRVANILGASHSIGLNSEEKGNRFDKHINELHATKVKSEGYPLTYYTLMDIAEDIVNAFESKLA